MCINPADLEGLVPLVSSIPSDSYTRPLWPPLLQGSVGLEGRDLMETSKLRDESLIFCITFGYGSLNLLPPAAG